MKNLEYYLPLEEWADGNVSYLKRGLGYPGVRTGQYSGNLPLIVHFIVANFTLQTEQTLNSC